MAPDEVPPTSSTEELERKIKEFIVIAEKFPDYKQKIFEVLLTNYLRSISQASEATETVVAPAPPITQKFVIPINVRAVLQQYSVPEDTIQKLFLVEGSEIQPKFSIKTTTKSDAQMQVALLTALENALKPGGKFEFSMEVVRTKCKDDYQVYDQPNFKAH